MITNFTQVEREIKASREKIYRAIIDASTISQWKVPDNMSMQIHYFEGWEGGKFRISLTYDQPTGTGKTTAHTDTHQGYYAKLISNEKIVEVDMFEDADSTLGCEMTVTITLSDTNEGTTVVARHEGLPASISINDNEKGWRMALRKLAKLVEIS